MENHAAKQQSPIVAGPLAESDHAGLHSPDYQQWIEAVLCSYAHKRLANAGPTFNRTYQPFFSPRTCSVGLPPPLLKLVEDYQLSPAECFMVVLAGELEDNYWVSLALAELLAPMEQAWLPLHLLADIMADMFAIQISPLDIAHHQLVKDQVLELEGSGPVPTRALRMNNALWQTLTHRQANIAGVEDVHKRVGKNFSANNVSGVRSGSKTAARLEGDDLSTHGQSTDKTVHHAAQAIRLGTAQTIVVRASTGPALEWTLDLARHLDRHPVSIPLSLWQSRSELRLMACYGNWLPCIEVALGPAEVIQLDQPKNVPLVIITGREGVVGNSASLEFSIQGTDAVARERIWSRVLPPALAATLIDSCLVNTETLQSIIDTAKNIAGGQPLTRDTIRDARFQLHGGRLRQLAQPVNRRVPKEALVLTPAVDLQIQQLLRRCCRREGLWQNLGLTSAVSQNTGVRALFSGDSGTGKTLAASYIATELSAPLFRLDLASVMNKYIGETEKNLGLLLDQAADTDAILLMDEADSLFGKRTETDNAGDRFANMLTNYLLSRIESHPGIVLLTTNGRSRIDSAFTRRLDSIIEFSPPGAEERYRIWLNHLGDRQPQPDICRLLAAYSDLSGGFIRNAVLAAATESPWEENSPQLKPVVLIAALCFEYHKLGKPVPAKLGQLARSHGVNDTWLT